jgi:hypothetical protein
MVSEVADITGAERLRVRDVLPDLPTIHAKQPVSLLRGGVAVCCAVVETIATVLGVCCVFMAQYVRKDRVKEVQTSITEVAVAVAGGAGALVGSSAERSPKQSER